MAAPGRWLVLFARALLCSALLIVAAPEPSAAEADSLPRRILALYDGANTRTSGFLRRTVSPRRR